MKIIRIATPLIAVALMSGAPFSRTRRITGTRSASQSWNTPPPGTRQAQAAFRDGLEAAQLDKAAHRQVEAKSSYLYLHPKVKASSAGGVSDDSPGWI